MKVSRSYLMGLGSGLILSALLAMVIPPVSINFAGSSAPAQINSDPNPQSGQNQSEGHEESVPEEPVTPEPEKSPLENPESNSETESNTQPTQTFVIPRGSTADKIANLLLAEGWISSKEEFLALVKDKNLASRFRAGSFELTQGMSDEEILAQLISQ